eukprot:Blabericola_migrator_1__7571@NODE_386_length_9117_cov_178_340884_g309_i0_p3_GENE_NODE_386_length_9117_cov_178_340884_g309_i0NODE_386_length_9117_cov_178_340884_g309_i0_p3_ORF_typecomplete_len467_score64_12Peptidase_M20/PF01546_28/1_1e44M20_dimer/PF07687_14/4_8e11_NODE_386_length_9117_cov_178_340884_g309_i064507850
MLILSLAFATCVASQTQVTHPNYVPRIGDFLEVGRTLELPKTLVTMRRALHREPEIGLSLPRTAAKVKKCLDTLSFTEESVSDGWAVNKTEGRGYGYVVDIGTGKEPCVIVRGDMDALPILEQTDVPWKSQIDGAMHACGHDAHTSILCGVASFLRLQMGRMKGTVRLVFQPGEESSRGMKRMIEEGLLEKRPAPSRALALHVHPGYPTGSIVATTGDFIASGTEFTATIRGKGGHAGIPAVSRDPVVAMAYIISAWQSLASRETLGLGPKSPGLLSVTSVYTPARVANIIPDEVTLMGTVRGPTRSVVNYMRTRMEEIAYGLCQAHRCKFDISYEEDIPSVHNNATLIDEELAPLLADPETQAMRLEPGSFYYVMEDFAFLSQEIPSAMFFLGIHDDRSRVHTNYSLHHPKFNLDEKALMKGSAFLATAALNLIEHLVNGNVTKTPPPKPDIYIIGNKSASNDEL